MRAPRHIFLLLSLLFALLACAPALQAQNATAADQSNATNASGTPPAEAVAEPPAEPPVEQPVDPQVEINNTLLGLADSIDSLRSAIKDREKMVKSASTPSQREELEAEIDALMAAVRERQKNFEQVAAGVDLDALSARQTDSLDWSSDLKELLSPILTELKKLTARPRDLERLRAEIARLNLVLPKIDAGLQRMTELKSETRNKDLIKRLTNYIDSWQEKRDSTASALNVAQLKLKEKLAEDSSLVSLFQRVFQNFFLSRGKNLLMALAAGGLVFAAMRLALRLFLGTSRGKRWAKKSTFFRAATVVYTFLCTLAATLMGLAILYNAGDWVLLGLTLLLLIGIIWSAKYNISTFTEQVKLLCNLGAVREGERIVYNGLPFKVGRINYYTTLVNPLLQGGVVRLRLDDLYKRTSRHVHADEEWFPTRKGDYVVLGDGTFGQVLLQTPEAVTLSVYGGNRQHYDANTFLAMKPRNLATGFGHLVTIGIDYKHQAQALEEIRALLELDVRAGLEQAGYGPHITGFFSQFKGAGESSLDLAVYAGFSGELASDYWALQRLLARLVTQSCTERGWNIPFPQRTLHIAASESAKNGCTADATLP